MGELINGYDILFHFINLIILVVAARLLLYKPVSKIMANRQERFAAERAELDAGRAEIEEFRKTKENIEAQAKEQARSYTKAQKERADEQAAQILAQAKEMGEKTAVQLVEDARAQSQAEIEEHKKDVAVAAVEIARHILQREITPQDEDKLLDDFLGNVTKGR